MGSASGLSRFAKENTNPKVGGSFECQTCSKDVEEAEHIIDKKVLQWVCEDGHVSKIEVLW